MTQEEYTKYELLFAKCNKMYRRWFWVLLANFLLNIVYFYFTKVGLPDLLHPYLYLKKHWLSGLVILSVSIPTQKLMVHFLILDKVFMEFVKKSRIRETADAYQFAARLKSKVEPDILTFTKSLSLREFEEYHVRKYNELRSAAVKLRHLDKEIEKLKETEARLEQRSDDLEKRIASALSLLSSEKDRAHYIRKFKDAKTVAAAEAFISEIKQKSQTPIEITRRQNAKVTNLERLLDDMSAAGLCKEAEQFQDSSREVASLKEKIILLKRAVSAQKLFNKQIVDKAEKPDQYDKAVSDQKTETEFDFSFLESVVSQEMIKCVLTAFSAKSMIGHESLKQTTASEYREKFKRSFPLRKFDETVEWLCKEQILLVTSQKKENFYVVNPHPSFCKSKLATEILMEMRRKK